MRIEFRCARWWLMLSNLMIFLTQSLFVFSNRWTEFNLSKLLNHSCISMLVVSLLIDTINIHFNKKTFYSLCSPESVIENIFMWTNQNVNPGQYIKASKCRNVCKQTLRRISVALSQRSKYDFVFPHTIEYITQTYLFPQRRLSVVSSMKLSWR